MKRWWIAVPLVVVLLVAGGVWWHSFRRSAEAQSPCFGSQWANADYTLTSRQIHRWERATAPARAACPNGGWDDSQIDWSIAPQKIRADAIADGLAGA
jgi:hypothetical protein